MYFVVVNVIDVDYESILFLEGGLRNVSVLNLDSLENKCKCEI